MGTSSAYGGPGNNTPLVPTWLELDSPVLPITFPRIPPGGEGQGDDRPGAPNPAPPNQPPIHLPPNANRFTAARTNFSRFASSGGHDRTSLGRAISHYVSTSSGGARHAARRMGASRATGGRLLDFMRDAAARGADEALRTFNLDSLAGRPIEEIFLGLADHICPDGGTVDEGIAREAFIETIADLAKNGITDLNTLTIDQIQTVFELYATHSIEARLYNDVGTKVIILPSNVREAERVQAQLRDFIRRGVADALTAARNTIRALTVDRVQDFISQVYERAFAILQSLGEAEATAT